MTYQLIETKTLGTATTAIQFTSVPQDGTDLLLLASLRNDRAAVAEDYAVTFNSDTTSGNYSSRRLLGSGSGVSSSSAWNFGALTNGGSSTSNTFSNIAIYIPNYAGSTQKSASVDAVTENNATESYQSITARLWTSTAPINAVAISNGDSGSTNNFQIGSTISLYKITRGTSNGVIVS